MDDRSGIWGILGLIGAVILYVVLRRVFPSLATAMLVIGSVILALIVLLTAAVLWSVFRKPKGKNNAPATDVTTVLSKGRSSLTELRRLGMRVKNPQIRALNEEICAQADKILRALKKQPEDIPGARKFLNYYLPTLGNILLKYLRLEKGGVPAKNITQSTISCLGSIQTAMEKQYISLFDNDILDLSVEMEVLMQVCRRDGLLADESVQLQDEGRNITLTL